MNTFTSNWTFVQEYDNTYHTPKNMVGASSDITISNPQIQWRGSDAQKTDNYNDSIENTYGESNSNFLTLSSIDSFPGVAYYEKSRVKTTATNGQSSDINYEVDITVGNTDIYNETGSISPGGTAYVYSDYFNKYQYNTSGGISTSWSFDNTVTTSSCSNELTDYGENTYTASTQNPEVQGDVSASLNTTLTDGETSSWNLLSGLQPNQENHFDHRYIDGSEQADFRIEFDWEVAISPPTSVQIVDSSNEGELTLDWDTSGTNANGYYVYRTQASGSSKSDYTQVADVTSPPYTDTGLEDGEQYYYRVSSHD